MFGGGAQSNRVRKLFFIQAMYQVVHDVQDNILGLFVFPEDLSTLLNCCLVCKRWLGHTRSIIFSSYVVTTWINWQRGRELKKTQAFLELFRSSFATFPAFVHILSISGESVHPPTVPSVITDWACVATEDILQAISTFSSLRNLQIISRSGWDILPSLISRTLCGLHNVTRLKLGHVTVKYPYDLFQATIGTFQSLEELDIHGKCTEPSAPTEHPDLRASFLRSITLTLSEGEAPSHLMNAFLLAPLAVTNLEVRKIRLPADAQEISSLIERSGPNLHHAVFDCKALVPQVSQNGAMIATEFPVSLYKNTDLVSLTIEMLIAPTASGVVPQSYWLVDMCRTLNSSSFSELTIMLEIDPIVLSVPMNVVVNFPSFLEALNRNGRFPRVKLIFKFTEESDTVTPERLREATEEIQTELAVISNQKKLKIVWDESQST